MQQIAPKIASMMLGLVMAMIFQDMLIALLAGLAILIVWEFIGSRVRRK